jgi:hypothetical protein
LHLLSIKYNSPPLKKVTLSKGHPFSNENVASVDGDNVAEFDYSVHLKSGLKRGVAFGGSGHIRGGDTVLLKFY